MSMRESDYDDTRSTRIAAAIVAGVALTGAIILLGHTWQGAGLRRLVLPGAWALVLFVAAWQIGRVLNRGNFEENLGFGLLALSVLPILLSHAGLLKSSWLIGCVALALVLTLRRRYPAAACCLSTLRRDAPFDSTTFVFFALGCCGAGWAFLGGLLPPAGMDALTYHLGFPAQFLARGHIRPPDGTYFYHFTQAGEMLNLFGLAGDSTGVACGIVLGLVPLLAAVSAARCAALLAQAECPDQPRTAAGAAALAFCTIATIPLMAIMAAHTKPDSLSLLFILLAMRRLLPDARSPWRVALFAGGALAVKLTALYAALPIMLVLFWQERRRPGALIGCALLAAILPGYWLGRNWLLFGHLLPQMPHLLQVVSTGAGPALLARLARPLGATFLFVSAHMDGPFGPLVAAAVIAALLALPRSGATSRLWVGISLAAALLWFISGGGSHAYATSGIARFLLPGLAPMLVVGSVAVARFMNDGTSAGRLLATLLVFAALVCLAVSFRITERYNHTLAFLTGAISREEYMSHWLTTDRLQRLGAEKLPKDAVVLSVGEPRLFYLGRDARIEVDGDLPEVYRLVHASGHDSAALARFISQEGITHVLDAPAVYAGKMLIGLSPALPCRLDRQVFVEFLSANGDTLVEDSASRSAIYVLKR